MIAIRMTGGLGNQLFEYATARALALRHGAEVGLDLRFYHDPLFRGGDIERPFELGAFSIRAVPLHQEVLPKRRKARTVAALHSQDALPKVTPFSVYRERTHAFDPNVLRQPDWTWLNGFFQCEQYFVDCSETIRSDLTILPEPSPENTAMAQRIRECEAVSVHIRRGDYVSDKRSADLFGPVRRAYYVRAVAHMLKHLQNPVFFVFSDEPDWVEKNLDLGVPLVVVRQRGPGYEDIRLMALCKHNIVANSTFSWWGAWLNPSPDKIVTAPMPWFRNPTVNTSTIVPAGWVRL